MTGPWPEKIAYVIDEAVAASGVSRRQLYIAMAAGKLKFSICANRRRIFPEDLRTYLRGGC